MRIVAGLFFFMLVSGCGNRTASIELITENDRVVGVSIPSSLIVESGRVENELVIRLRDSESSTGIIGEYTREQDRIVFRPIVSFTPGALYEVFYEEQIIARFEVPFSDAEAPSVLNIYPTTDTLPENTLKMYVSFTRPMREHVALNNITLLTEEGDTVADPFLDLKPELWNEAGDMLTLWFDPGRIKRDLIPNREMGAPLEKGNEYRMVISKGWKDKLGRQLQSSYEKVFVVVGRDSIMPDLKAWSLQLPGLESSEPLIVRLDEPLDYQLLLSTITILDEGRNIIPCKFKVDHAEQQLRIEISSLWRAGKYFLVVENRLEDLAGNNLVRPFDRDMETTSLRGDIQSTSEIEFVIE